MSRIRFDAFRVRKVAEFAHPTGEFYCEPIEGRRDQKLADDLARRQFWTVYGYRNWTSDHETAGLGWSAIGDFATEDLAVDMAHALAAGGGPVIE